MTRSLLSYIQRSPLLRTAVGSFGLKIAAAGLGFISSILLARLLGPKEFGIYTIIMAAVNLAAMVATLGLPGLATREVAKYEAREQWGLLKGFIRTGHRWVLLVSIVGYAAGAGLIIGEVVIPDLPWLIVIFALLLIPLTAFNHLRAAILRGLHWVILADIPELLLRPVLMLLMVLATFQLIGRADAGQVIALQLVATFCAFAVGTWFLQSRTPQPVKQALPEMQTQTWGRAVHPFFWIAIISLLESQIGIYLLGYLSGPEQVGLFQIASQPVSLVVMGLVAVNLPLQPKLAVAWTMGNMAEVQRLVADATKLGTIVALVSAAILIPFAELILHLYGEQYTVAVNVLRVLVVSQFINALAGPCGLVLAVTGRQKLALYGVVAALFANALASTLLIPKYAAFGAAVSAMAGMLVWNVIQAYWAWKHMNIVTPMFLYKRIIEIR